MRRSIAFRLLVLAVFAGMCPVMAGAGTFTSIDYPGATMTVVTGIDGSGRVLGYYRPGPGDPVSQSRGSFDTHSFLFLANGFLVLPDAFGAGPGSGTFARGLNDNSMIVGFSEQASQDRGFLYGTDTGTFSRLDFPTGESRTAPTAVNALGQIVGQYITIDQACFNCPRGFILFGSDWTSLEFPGALFTIPNGVSGDADSSPTRVVGVYGDGNGTHGFVWDVSGFGSIDFPGARSTVASGITAAASNDSIRVVGFYLDGSGVGHGFLLAGGIFTTLDFPGAKSTIANGINSGGQIVGTYTDSIGNTHGFRFDP